MNAIRAGLALAPALLLALAGCDRADKPEADAAASASVAAPAAAPDAKPGLSLTAAKLMLPVIEGRPGAAYFTFANNADKPVTIAAITIQGVGRTEMHETVGGKMSPIKDVTVAPGETVAFERGGKHIMAFDVAPTLTAGGTSEITLTFADGDKLSAPLAIEAMAGAMAGGTMNHGSGH